MGEAKILLFAYLKSRLLRMSPLRRAFLDLFINRDTRKMVEKLSQSYPMMRAAQMVAEGAMKDRAKMVKNQDAKSRTYGNSVTVSDSFFSNIIRHLKDEINKKEQENERHFKDKMRNICQSSQFNKTTFVFTKVKDDGTVKTVMEGDGRGNVVETVTRKKGGRK